MLADAKPLSESLSGFNLKDWDLNKRTFYFVLGSESLDDLHIVSLSAVLGKDADLSLDFLVLALKSLSDLLDSLAQQRVSV